MAQSFDHLLDLLIPINKYALANDEEFKHNQLGKHIDAYEEEGDCPDLEAADLILLGCGDARGAFSAKIDDESPNSIRAQYYSLFHWHEDVKVADLGNVRSGATLNDTYAAIRMILREIRPLGKLVVLLGNTHDLTSAQYESYADLKQLVNVVCVDARIDMDMNSPAPNDHFLVPMFTGEPNFIRKYSHVAFQSYMVHPSMLETISDLGFDCFRVGVVKEKIEEMEPVIRDADMLSFDIAAVQHAHAPSNRLTPNGLDGEQACTLMQFAGLASNISTIGIYGHRQEQDEYELTAKQISQMLWYLMDGMHKRKEEAALSDRSSFNEFNLCFADFETVFLQSRKTGRWWMQIPDHSFVPCSGADYVTATQNEMPERWLRAIERM